MKTLRRYLTFEIFTATALVLAALLMLFALFDVMHEMSDLGRGNYTLGKIATFVALSTPTRFHEALPIATLIGTLFALANLVSTSEYTIIRTSGVSLLRFCGALLTVAVILAILTLAFGELIAPPMQELAQRVRSQAVAGIVAQEFRSGLWVKEGRTYVNVGQVTHDLKLQRVLIYEFDDKYHLRKIASAREGEHVAARSWRLTDVTVTTFDGARVVVERVPELDWSSVLEPKLLSMLMVAPAEMSIRSLYTYSNFLRENHQNAERYEVAFWMKVIYPLTPFVMILLALAFSRYQVRGGAAGGRIFTGIMLGLAFVVLNRLLGTFATLYDWPPALSALTSPVFFLAMAVSMLWRDERR